MDCTKIIYEKRWLKVRLPWDRILGYHYMLRWLEVFSSKKNIILMELCEQCGTSQTNSPSGSKASSRILKSSLVFQTFLGSVASKKPVQGVSIQSMMLSFVIFFASSKCLFSVSVYSFSQPLISASLTRPSCISRSLYTRSTSWEKEREKKIVKSFPESL